jgi:hypothetical protein
MRATGLLYGDSFEGSAGIRRAGGRLPSRLEYYQAKKSENLKGM